MGNEQVTTPVDVITRDCRYTGSVATRGFRLSDILSDQRTDILEMHETLTSVAGTRSTDVRWKEVFLKKNSILLVIPKGKYEAPIRRRNNYVERHRYGAMIVLPGHILSGIVHLPARTNSWMVLDEDAALPSFIGVTDVTVHKSIYDFIPAHCDVVILRRHSIESAQLTARPLPKQAVTSKSQVVAGHPDGRAPVKCD